MSIRSQRRGHLPWREAVECCPRKHLSTLQYRIGVVEVRYLDMCQHQSGLVASSRSLRSPPLRAVSDRMGHTTKGS
jgi:hypothetical protein